MNPGEDVIGEAGRVGVMPLDPQVSFMMGKPVENIGGVAHANVDDLGAEGRVLIRDVGIEELARFGAFSFASSPEWLSIRGRGGSIAPVLCEGRPRATRAQPKRA